MNETEELLENHSKGLPKSLMAPIKILRFHDLQHCHAVWLIQSGASLIGVTQQLGNGPELCYRSYSGFELKKESVERLEALIDR
jgi:hypothetical protein